MMKKKFLISFLVSGLIFIALFSKIEKILFVDGELGHGTNMEGEEIVPVDKNEMVVLLVGVDSNDIAKSKGTRTDTMMVVKLEK